MGRGCKCFQTPAWPKGRLFLRVPMHVHCTPAGGKAGSGSSAIQPAFRYPPSHSVSLQSPNPTLSALAYGLFLTRGNCTWRSLHSTTSCTWC